MDKVEFNVGDKVYVIRDNDDVVSCVSVIVKKSAYGKLTIEGSSDKYTPSGQKIGTGYYVRPYLVHADSPRGQACMRKTKVIKALREISKKADAILGICNTYSANVVVADELVATLRKIAADLLAIDEQKLKQ